MCIIIECSVAAEWTSQQIQYSYKEHQEQTLSMYSLLITIFCLTVEALVSPALANAIFKGGEAIEPEIRYMLFFFPCQ